MSEEALLASLAEIQRALGRLESAVTTLIGNGQPGIVSKLQDDVDSLKQSRSYFYGAAAVLAAIDGGVHYLLHKLGIT